MGAAMGVAVNANEVLPKVSAKKKRVEELMKLKGLDVPVVAEEVKKEKSNVVEKLEVEAKYEAKQTFRFTPIQVQLITYMMDKHGEDWSAMARDPKNHYQETAAKLKGMVNKFVSIPEHYVVYCKERGLIQPTPRPVADKDVYAEDEGDGEDDENDKDEELEDMEDVQESN